MKKIFVVAALLALSSLAFGATTVPIQLLNPAGSTSGQAVLSTGPSTAPAWGPVSLAGITGTLAVANGGTGATAAAAARTNLGAAATSGTLSQFAATTSAQLLGVISDETGSGSLVFSASPTFTGTVNAAAITASGLITPSSTVGIKGTTTNDNAQAGSIGEYPTPTNLNAVPLTTNVAANVSSISLPGGDYDIECTANFAPAGSTNIGLIEVGVSTTSATQPALGGYQLLQSSLTTGLRQTMKSGRVRVPLASTTTVYCVATSVFGTSTMTADGFMSVRRPR